MDYGRDSQDVIQIIGGGSPRDGAESCNDQPIFVDKRKRRLCTYDLEEQPEPRDRTLIVLGHRSNVGYQDGATRNRGAPPPAPSMPPPPTPPMQPPPASLMPPPPAPPLSPAPPLAPPPAPPLAPPVATTVSMPTFTSANWRTKICHRWERTGYCLFGSNCTYAHGAAELQGYRGQLVDKEANPNKPEFKPPAAAGSSVGRSGGFESAIVQKPPWKWKGPDKISRIYGDWIDDIE